MLSKKTSAVAAFAAAFAALASSASAQTPPAAAAPAAPQQQLRHGPAIPGICAYSADAVIATSEVGKAVIARLKQIGAEAQAEVRAEETSVTNEARTLESQRATLAPDAFEKRATDLELRKRALARKADLRQRELGATEQKALGRVNTELLPVVLQVYQQSNCSLLLADGAVVLANPQMDITDKVVQGLNAKIKTFTFNRERLDVPQAAPGAAPAAAAPKPATPPKK